MVVRDRNGEHLTQLEGKIMNHWKEMNSGRNIRRNKLGGDKSVAEVTIPILGDNGEIINMDNCPMREKYQNQENEWDINVEVAV